MTKFCPYCGSEVDPDSIYCLNCGKKLPEKAAPSKTAVSWDTAPSEPARDVAYQQPTAYKQVYQPRPYHPSMKPDIIERCVALIIDDVINQFCCIYGIVKDGIREGQSIGKGLFALRVVDFNSGMPATIGQSFIRNCFPGCVDGCCCYLVALIDEDGRRIGDHMAGTVVIKDL